MTETEFVGRDPIGRRVEHIPAAFAVTRGAQHTLVFANAAFRRLAAAGKPVAAARSPAPLMVELPQGLTALLDRVFRFGAVARDEYIPPVNEKAPAWCCTVWPAPDRNGEPHYLIIEVRVALQSEHTIALQREVAERMLLSALRERDAADVAEVSRRGAAFLAAESRRLAESLEESATLDAMTRMSLPRLGAWCFVDILDDDRSMRRLAIVHPDPARQDLIRDLGSRWQPESDDSFGVPAMLGSAKPKLIAEGTDEALFRPSPDQESLRILRALGVGPLLTVPLVLRDRVAGAVTFVGDVGGTFTPQDIELAEDLAARSAMALDRARLYGEAMALKRQAESDSEAKSTFLGSMSHELRTPLNAIGGYVELIDMGLHGPVTEQQHADLVRIRASQLYLTGLIEDLLNFTKLGSGELSFEPSAVIVRDSLAAIVAMVEPLISKKHLIHDGIVCDGAIVARADPDRLSQILLNLLTNAIKFSMDAGRIGIECEAAEGTVLICISDTGPGIPAERLEAIFKPFVQVNSGLAGRDRGVGLGLAISRGLARAMGGDLTVESTVGKGSRFTITLPRAGEAA